MLVHGSSRPCKPERVVIVGATGFVGGSICRRVKAADVPVLALDRPETDLLQPGAAARLRQLLRPTDSLVFVSAVAPAKNVSMLMQNLSMAEQVCQALDGDAVAHVVYISSDAVYADDANPVDERSAVAPSTIHGMMHAARELMLKSSIRAPLAFLRPTLIYGAADPHGGYGPNRFRRQAQKGEPVQIFGEGEEQRDHVAVDDVAEIARLVLFHRSSGVINVATGVSTSFATIAQLVARQFGVAVTSQPRPGPRPHLQHRFFDVTDCHKSFPGYQYVPLHEGLERARGGCA